MTFNDYLKLPSSKKITIVEIDTPLTKIWINHSPGIWKATMTPGSGLFIDDRGNSGYWEGRNGSYINIQSLSVNGLLYSEVDTLIELDTNKKTWFYDTTTTIMYIRFDDWNPPEVYFIVVPGAALGFTNIIDETTNNYFEDIYYEPLLMNVPNFSKAKDSLFFGLLQYQGGTIIMDNTNGHFDDFAQRDLYGQPIRIKISFEGLPYEDSLLVYNGKVEDFSNDFINFNLNVTDIRKQISRSLPVNSFTNTDTLSAFYFPSIDSKLVGTPVPIAYGSVIRVPAYRTSAGNWTFADTTFNSIDSGIVVYDKDDNVFSHGGTETDGTFTGSDTTGKLTVTFTQSAVVNGLDIITDIMKNYENTDFNALNYDTVEWASEIGGVIDSGIWIGKGSIKSTINVIELICIDNQGIFDVLADGRFTFRSFDPDRIPSHEIFEDELVNDPFIDYESDEFLTSVKIEHSYDKKEREYEVYTNLDFEYEVFGRYRNHRERTFTTSISSVADAITLSDKIMDLSKVILPKVNFVTKTENIAVRVLDNILYIYERQDGGEILKRSRYQILSINLDLTRYEVTIGMKLIEEDDKRYITIDGGLSTTDYDWYDGGSASFSPPAVINGGSAG